jgi:hypothetical protein
MPLPTNIGGPVAIHSHESGSEDDPGSGRGCRTLQIFSPPTYIATLMRRSHQNLPLSTLPKVAERIVISLRPNVGPFSGPHKNTHFSSQNRLATKVTSIYAFKLYRHQQSGYHFNTKELFFTAREVITMEYTFIGPTNGRDQVPSFIVATENASLESTFDTTFAPAEEPAREAGVIEEFIPLRIPFRDGECLTADFEPVSLFKQFVPENTLISWVSWTNKAAQADRGPGWIDTTVSELYTWLGLVVYMGIHK